MAEWALPFSKLWLYSVPPSRTASENAFVRAAHTRNCRRPFRFPSGPKHAPSSTRFASVPQNPASVLNPCWAEFRSQSYLVPVSRSSPAACSTFCSRRRTRSTAFSQMLGNVKSVEHYLVLRFRFRVTPMRGLGAQE
jgi:hypothetical protein